MFIQIICLTLFVTVSHAQSVHNLPEIVSRMNWGVLFNKGPVIMNGISKYRHTYEIKIPQLEFTAISPIDCNTDKLETLHCTSINDLITSINGQVTPLVAELKSRITNWMRSIPNVDTLDYSKAGQSLAGKRRRRRSTNLGPDYCEKVKSGDYEAGGGGGFLSSIGSFFSSLAGTPTWDDIKVIDKHICDLADAVDLNKEQILKLGNDFSTFSKAANKRMDALQDGMVNINTRVTETNALLVTLSQRVFTGLNELEKRIKLSMVGTELLFTVQKQLYKFQGQIDIMSATVEEFGNGINVLLSGRLPPQLVSVDEVKSIIDVITNKLTEAGGTTRLVDVNPALYYLINNVVFTKSEKMKSLFIMVTFPIYSIGGLMATYRIDRTHISISEDLVASTRIENLPDFIAVSADGLYYSEFTTSELTSCEGDVIKTCKNERSLQSFTDQTCAAALYKDDKTKVLELCDVRYDQGEVPSKAVKITDDTYLIHSKKAGTGATWTMSCPLIPSFVTTTIEACNACVLQVTCGCELTAPGEFYIPLQLSGCSDVLSSYIPDVKPKYPVNLPVLSALFDTDFTATISGSKLLQYKWKVDIPDIKPLEEKWDQTVQVSRKYSADLNKLIVKTKENRKVYATKAAALLKKATDFTDLKLTPIKTLSDTFKNLQWITNIGQTGGIAGVAVGFLLPILALVFSCYVFCKRRV